ncbi:MAG TPA: hypothetical protein VFZ09_13830 [Archangium sp.]|uniref:hypothetical protein n=1 Tax=Archangium sp. TaxID=1872627 RepID=UPI002E35388C|nr:hypothetical protein [Archangium sp.]HEX5747318.1 hypothetical protein [Archangium sp.]
MTLSPNPISPRPNSSKRLTRVLLTSLLLGACATRPGHPGAAPRGDLRLDSETVARMRYAGLVRGTGTAVSSSTLAVGATLVLATPVVLAVYHHNRDKVVELQESLAECARMAEHRVNSDHFGNRPPTREECGEELEVDGSRSSSTSSFLAPHPKIRRGARMTREVLMTD